MKTIGFYAQVDLKIISENSRETVNLSLEFVKQQLNQFNVNCEWVDVYEDGKIEFEIDALDNTDIINLEKAIKEIRGLVVFNGFY